MCLRPPTVCAIRLGGVMEANRTQAPKQQTAGNWRDRTWTWKRIIRESQGIAHACNMLKNAIVETRHSKTL